MPARLVAVAVVLGLALVAAPASASTISGRVAGAKLPKAGQGFTTVRAVQAKSLVIVDVATVRSHRYRLKVPAGRYWMFAATTPLRGKAGVDRPAGKVVVRKGKRKTVPVSMRKRKRGRPKLPRLPSAHAAFVNVKHPAVWVQHFSVSGRADFNVLRKGIADMLITDLGPPLKSACGGVIVEREKLSFIIAEQLRSQDPRFDPSTRLPTDQMIAHNREVSGSLTVTGATTTLTVDVKNVATGTTRSVTRSAATDRFFELETSVVQEVARLICGDKPPGHYSGQASGSLSGSNGSSFQKLSWNGDVRLRYTGDLLPEDPGDPPGEYALYEAESGSIHVSIDGVHDGCPYHGVADVTIVPSPGLYSRVQQGVDEPTYSMAAYFPDDTPPMPVITAASTTCTGTTSMYPLAGRAFLATESRRSSSSTLVGTSTFAIGPVTTELSWSLAPEAG
jgi:hypothetical protein